MFDVLNKFLTKMKEANCCFTVFPNNQLHYGMLANLPPYIEDAEDWPTKVDKWLTNFPQAKPQFQGGDVYMMALIGWCKLMKENGDWFRETKFGLGRQTSKWKPQPPLDGYSFPQTFHKHWDF